MTATSGTGVSTRVSILDGAIAIRAVRSDGERSLPVVVAVGDVYHLIEQLRLALALFEQGCGIGIDFGGADVNTPEPTPLSPPLPSSTYNATMD